MVGGGDAQLASAYVEGGKPRVQISQPSSLSSSVALSGISQGGILSIFTGILLVLTG